MFIGGLDNEFFGVLKKVYKPVFVLLVNYQAQI